MGSFMGTIATKAPKDVTKPWWSDPHWPNPGSTFPPLPDYKSYDAIEEVPRLRAFRNDLAKEGLHDPWMRYVPLFLSSGISFPSCSFY